MRSPVRKKALTKKKNKFFNKVGCIRISDLNMAIQITESNFEAEVLQSPVPVLVDFWATWCGPCKMVMPIVEQIATEMAGAAKVCKANVEEGGNQNLATRYNIRSVPTLLFFKNGELVDTIVGATSKDNILAHLRACM